MSGLRVLIGRRCRLGVAVSVMKEWKVRGAAWFLGAVFLLSAATKLAGLNAFEILLVKEGMVGSRQLAAVLARGLCGVELALGLCMLQRNLLRRVVIPAMSLLLVGFSLYLAYAAVARGEMENCGCFGEAIVMTPLQALVKNLLMLGVAAYLWRALEEDPARWQVPATVLTVSMAAAFVLFPIRVVTETVDRPVAGAKPKPSPFAPFRQFSDGDADLTRGHYLVAFFSLDCEHCQEAARQLVAWREELDLPPVRAFYLGPPEAFPEFEMLTGADFPYLMAEPEEFFAFIDTEPPRIYLLHDGQPVKIWDVTLTRESLRKALAEAGAGKAS